MTGQPKVSSWIAWRWLPIPLPGWMPTLLKEGKHYQRKIEKKEDFSIETYEFLEDTEYLKKGKYIEIFFKDHISNISEQITKILKEMIDQKKS